MPGIQAANLAYSNSPDWRFSVFPGMGFVGSFLGVTSHDFRRQDAAERGVSMLQIDQTPGVRYMVMRGEDSEPGRRGDKVLVAQSTCSLYCPDGEVFEKVVTELRASDARLKALPEEQRRYDWQTVYFDPEQGADNGAGTLVFGVAWYDEEFFQEKGAAYTNGMHTKMFAALGVPEDSVHVQHWQPMPAAA